ncbi:MAG TPA: hypothetical protein VFN41_09835 [Candidatus Limnocylindrales bacterium]|nr:hypothetical protein [Candidatus Limnocylindrales bacterium]
MEGTVRPPGLIGVVVAAMLIVAILSGCAGEQPSQAAATLTSAAVATDDPSPTPTSHPTPSPTATPTPAPTPDPTPSAALLQWLGFLHHSQRADERVTDLRTAWLKLKPSDFKGGAAFAGRLRSWAKAEKTWLKSHPALACYRPTFVEYSRAVQEYDKAALAYIDAYRSLRESKFQEAFDAEDAAEAHLTKAADSHRGSEAACTAA